MALAPATPRKTKLPEPLMINVVISSQINYPDDDFLSKKHGSQDLLDNLQALDRCIDVKAAARVGLNDVSNVSLYKIIPRRAAIPDVFLLQFCINV